MQLLTDALRRLLGDTIQVGKSARPNDATRSALPGTAQQEIPGSTKSEGGSSARIDPADVQRVTRKLAVHIGPIAGIVVKRAIAHCNSVEDLYLKVAEEIDSRDEREKFLQGRAPSPSTPVLNVAEDTTLASNTSRAAGLPPPSEGNDVQSRTARPATGIPLSNRRKNLLLASAGGAFLFLLLVLVVRFAPWGGAGSSQPSQTSDQETHISPAEMPAKNDKLIQSATPRATDENQPKSPHRVHVSEEVSHGLLIRPISPVYPVLARQAHIQGKVVLDADISKDGRVETLKVISGDPLLIQAALDAAKALRYKPYVLNGEPAEMNTQIIVGFTLSGG